MISRDSNFTARLTSISQWTLCVCALSLLASCGGSGSEPKPNEPAPVVNPPEPRVFEYYVVAQAGSSGENSCRPKAASSFAQAAKPFQEQIIEKARGYKVLRSECRFSPQAEPNTSPAAGLCFAQYKFSVIVPPDDNGRVDGVMRGFGILPINDVTFNQWQGFNEPLIIDGSNPNPVPAYYVSNPPKFTPGYLDCGSP